MITKTELIERVVNANTNWMIEAAAGFGKTVLIEQIRSALVEPLLVVRGPVGSDADVGAFLNAASGAAHRIGYRDLGESLAGTDAPHGVIDALADHRCSLAVDDLHRWDNDVASFVGQLAEETEHRDAATALFVLARRLPDELNRLRLRPTWSSITADELAFTADQLKAELERRGAVDEDISGLLHELTGGWPIAVMSALARMEHGSDPNDLLRAMGHGNSLVEGLLRDSLQQLAGDDICAASTLTMLPFFDEGVADIVGGTGLLDRLARAGLPITRQADGWSTIAEVFRPPLVEASVPRFNVEVVDYLVARGEIHAAINVCISMGQNPEAARVVAALDYEQEARLDVSMLNAAMTAIGDSAILHPRSLLVQAQVNANFGRFDEAEAAIVRAADLLADVDPELSDPTHIEVLLELGLWRIYQGRAEESLRMLERCEQAVQDDDSGANRARILDLRGMISQIEGNEHGLLQAQSDLTEALEIWRRLQEPRAAAVTAFRLSASVLFRLGKRQEALDLLESLPSVGRIRW